MRTKRYEVYILEIKYYYTTLYKVRHCPLETSYDEWKLHTGCVETTHHLSSFHHILITLILLCCSIHDEVSAAVLFDGEDRGHVPTAIAIIRSRPYGDKLFIEHVLVTLLNELVCPCNELQLIYMIELDRI